MKLTYNAVSHRGLVRRNNEDAVLVGNMIIRDNADTFEFEIPDDGIIFPALICDGVGGNSRGEEASMSACRHFNSFFRNLQSRLTDDQLIRCVKQIFSEINNTILQSADGCGMATTLTGMLVYGSGAFILNAGDSRTYRLRYGNLKRLTNEHSMEINNHRVITNCLGMPDATLDIGISAIVPGDTYIICSDGLFDMIDDETIATNASSAEALLDLALSAGGHDNTSLILVRFEDSQAIPD